MAFTLDKFLYIPGEDFQYDRDLHIKNWRALRAYLENANDILPMISKTELPLTSDWPIGTLVVYNEKLYQNRTDGWHDIGEKTFQGCYLYKNAEQSISPSTWTPIDWDVEGRDAIGVFSSGTPNRVTVQTAGFYELTGQVWLKSSGASGEVLAERITLNGTNDIVQDSAPGGIGAQTVAPLKRVIYAAANDYFQFEVYHAFSGAAATEDDSLRAWMAVEYLGA